MLLIIFTFFAIKICEITANKTQGNHTVAVIKGHESYELLSSSCSELFSFINKLVRDGEITIDGKNVAVDVCLGGDYKFLQMVLGMSGATSNLACIWCLCHKKDRFDMSKPEEFYWQVPMVRTLDSIKKCALTGKNSCVNPPLLDIPLGNIVLDELHMMLRITDKLTDNLVQEAIDWDKEDNYGKPPKLATRTRIESLITTINSCGVCFSVWEKRNADGSGSDTFHFTSLMGTDKKLLLEKLPSKLDGIIRPDTSSTVIELWKTFHEIYIMMQKRNPSESDLANYFAKANSWVTLFTSLGPIRQGYNNARVTPYMHSMVYHVPRFMRSHKGIRKFSGQVITTRTGKVEGVIEPSSLPGKMVQKFLNIPYAEPPVGKLRFSKPEAKKPWKGILNNSNEAIACWQEFRPGITLTEDCLILNIWTPYPQPTNATVMIWIHGGSFIVRHSGEYHGQNFVAVGDVILVTINYRLSVLGFLSTGDHRIKGNFGLFDQRLAMQWVKENIDSFGGNPQSITIFGLSAGGASVSAHTLSEKSWPYFDRAILQSGTLTMRWATASKSLAKKALGLFLNSVNCSNNENLLECLRNNVTVTDLEKLYNTKPFSLKDAWFAPYVDGDFLTNSPKKLWDTKTVKKNDVILGVTKDEYIASALLQKSRNITFFTKTFQKVLKQRFANFSKAVYKQALRLYHPECTPSFIEAFKPIVAFYADFFFICATKNEANLRSQILTSSNIYLYQYSYSSPVPFSLFPHGTFGFAAHGMDAVSTFGKPINNRNYPSEDQILSLRMILYWTNFAKTGDPNSGTTKLPVVFDKVYSLPKWPKYTNSGREYLDMESLSRMVVRKRLRKMYCDFLNNPEEFTRQATSVAIKHIARVALFYIVVLLQVIF